MRNPQLPRRIAILLRAGSRPARAWLVGIKLKDDLPSKVNLAYLARRADVWLVSQFKAEFACYRSEVVEVFSER